MSTTQERSNNPRRRQGNRGGQRHDGRNRSRNRGRNREQDTNRQRGPRASGTPGRNGRQSQSAKPSLARKLLSILTFGLVSTSKKPARKSGVSAARTGRSENSAQSARPEATADRGPAGARAGGRERASRTMELREVTSGRLYVGNLSYDATESDLIDLFSGIGTVQGAEVVSHKRTMRSKGYAFVEMLSLEEAKRAVEILHDKDFMGRPLIVSGAKSEGRLDGDSDD